MFLNTRCRPVNFRSYVCLRGGHHSGRENDYKVFSDILPFNYIPGEEALKKMPAHRGRYCPDRYYDGETVDTK